MLVLDEVPRDARLVRGAQHARDIDNALAKDDAGVVRRVDAEDEGAAPAGPAAPLALAPLAERPQELGERREPLRSNLGPPDVLGVDEARKR